MERNKKKRMGGGRGWGGGENGAISHAMDLHRISSFVTNEDRGQLKLKIKNGSAIELRYFVRCARFGSKS